MKRIKCLIFFNLIFIIFNITSVSAASVSELMQAATEPIGKCLYVYGGGWNQQDVAAGIEALSYGISPRWVEFYNQNDSAYDYKTTKYQIHNGLDCTAYIGWCMYQMFGTQYSNNGYVYLSKNMANSYKNIFGAQLTPAGQVSDYRCGDVMSMAGHAYLVLGKCKDQSVVFFHASPPNVSLCGTYTPDGNPDSEAIRLAEKYMSKYFSECYERYPRCSRNTAYLTNYTQVRLPESVLPDVDGYKQMYADVILMDMFETIKVYVNGNRVAKEDSIYIRNDITFVPLRVVSESLGANVEWFENERKVVITKDGTTIVVYPDSCDATVNGQALTFAYPVFIDNDKTYIPVRFIAEHLNCNVDWDGKWQKVFISNNN